MAVLKCKMCGGTLNINVGDTVAVCEYCETRQRLCSGYLLCPYQGRF